MPFSALTKLLDSLLHRPPHSSSFAELMSCPEPCKEDIWPLSSGMKVVKGLKMALSWAVLASSQWYSRLCTVIRTILTYGGQRVTTKGQAECFVETYSLIRQGLYWSNCSEILDGENWTFIWGKDGKGGEKKPSEPGDSHSFSGGSRYWDCSITVIANSNICNSRWKCKKNPF